LGSLLILFVGFGWGKPVPFNPINLSNPKRDSALIALAGPFSNFALALITAGLFHLVGGNNIVGVFLYLTIFYNLVLGIFNLIPVHPLDGFKVLGGLLPTGLYMQWMQIAPYGVYILLLMIFTRTTNIVLDPFINLFLNLLGLEY
jgi:Zn-dependent protease